MNSVSEHKVDKTEIDPVSNTKDNTIYIWLDILGFSDETEKNDSSSLANTLKIFQGLFTECNDYGAHIISDGILLVLKDCPREKLREIFKDIGQKQLKFILDNKYFVRGGIAVGNKIPDEKRNDGLPEKGKEKEKHNIILATNGLSRSVKLESKHIDWPIIGTNKIYLERIKELHQLSNIDDLGLLKAFNNNGEEIYFIDFISNIEKDSTKENFVTLLYKNIGEFAEKPRIRSKYIWLVEYVFYKNSDIELKKLLGGVIL